MLFLQTRCFLHLSIIMQSQLNFIIPSSLASLPLTFPFSPKRQIFGLCLSPQKIISRKYLSLIEERVGLWTSDRDVIPGRGRHMSKVSKVGMCEVCLRKYQITDLEHEVHERILEDTLENLVEARTWKTLNLR